MKQCHPKLFERTQQTNQPTGKQTKKKAPVSFGNSNNNNNKKNNRQSNRLERRRNNNHNQLKIKRTTLFGPRNVIKPAKSTSFQAFIHTYTTLTATGSQPKPSAMTRGNKAVCLLLPSPLLSKQAQRGAARLIIITHH